MTDHASRSANQAKAEPFPASATDAEAETPGAGAPQEPAGAVAGRPGSQGDAADVPNPATDPSPGTSEQSPVVQGLHVPDVDEEHDTRL